MLIFKYSSLTIIAFSMSHIGKTSNIVFCPLRLWLILRWPLTLTSRRGRSKLISILPWWTSHPSISDLVYGMQFISNWLFANWIRAKCCFAAWLSCQMGWIVEQRLLTIASVCVCVIAVWQAKTLQYSIFEQWHCQDCGFARTFAVRLLKLCGNNFRYEIENFAQNCPFMVNAYLIQIGLHRYQAREYRRFWCADADVCSGWAGTGHFYRRWITF